MSLIDRYILRQVVGSFLLVLGVLTGIVWLTSALRQLDLLVTQGQTILIFLGVTLLAMPLLIQLIAPFALFIAFLFTLNKLNTDSELIVMSASGLSQARLFRPFAIVIVAVMVAAWALSLVVVPGSLRTLRETVTAARADFISQVIQPGRFTTVDSGLTFHVRERGSNGLLLGVFVSDNREPDVTLTYLGTRGVIARTPQGTLLVLEDGQIIRKPKRTAQTDASDSGYGSLISFERYVFNLSDFVAQQASIVYPAQERFTWDLITGQALEDALRVNPDPRTAGRLRSELHDRFAGPLYVAASALIAFLMVGRARTTRQSRTESVVIAITLIVGLRIAGFFASALTQREAWGVALIHGIPLATIAVCWILATASGPRRGGDWIKLPERLPFLAGRPKPAASA